MKECRSIGVQELGSVGVKRKRIMGLEIRPLSKEIYEKGQMIGLVDAQWVYPKARFGVRFFAWFWLPDEDREVLCLVSRARARVLYPQALKGNGELLIGELGSEGVGELGS